MTRINVIPVSQLVDKHLIAEYREIMRLPNNLKTSLNRKSKPFNENEIPNEYKLGSGHVKFFYNKFGFLKNRFNELIAEMNKRGFTTNFKDDSIFNVASKYMGNYTPTNEAMKINKQRIKERLT